MTTPEYNQYREQLKKGRYMEAARLAEIQYLAGSPNNPFWLTRQAAALSRANKYEQALGVAQQALALQPANPYGLLAVAEALSGLQRMEEAFLYYEAIAKDPKLYLFAYNGMLHCLCVNKQWERILQLLSLWEMPSDSGWPYRVKALAGLDRLDEAIDACRQWLSLSPDNPQALWELTELEIRQEGLETVLQRMGRIAKIGSRPPVYKEIYASLCRRAGQPELALEQYEKLTQTDADPRLQRKQAFVLAKSGRETEAIPMLEELLKLDPNNFFLHSAYVPACKRAELLGRALQFYEELLEMHPDEKPIYGRIKHIKKILGVKP